MGFSLDALDGNYFENNPTTFGIIYFIILFGFGISCIYGSLTDDDFLDDYLEWEEVLVKKKKNRKNLDYESRIVEKD